MAVARKNQLEGIQHSHDELIRTLEEQQAHSGAVASWKDMIPIGPLKPRPDEHQFSSVYDYVARLCGPYDDRISAHDSMVELIESKEFLTTFEEDPEAREDPVIAAREMLPDDKPTAQDRERANKAKAKALRKNRRTKTPATAAAATVADDEPKPNWKQLIRDKAATGDETQ
jgi:hypothetical protein